MKKGQVIKDAAITIGTMMLILFMNLNLQRYFFMESLVPMISVLGVFFISLKTEGYIWGVTASLLSVLKVNYVFTFPYYTLDLISKESIFSAMVMLVVAIMTSTLTTKIKMHEKMNLESEKERMRANLLRAVSHDLRTPLTSIYGSCSVIMDNYDDLKKEQQLKLLGEIHEDCAWLNRMVENLLSVTRIDGDKVQVTKTSTVLEELIDTVVMKFYKRCPDQKVHIQIPEEFISIPMDAMLMEQVLTNILENAVNHAEGMTKLELNVSIEDSKAVFRIKDDGCGIPEDRMDDLFTGYLERKNAPMDGQRSNMGIGLSVCSTIIKAHGSEIFAYNRKNKGAVFSFALEMEELYE